MAFQEYLHHGTHAPVHHKLGSDQQGHRHQEADVSFHLMAKNASHRYRTTPVVETVP